MYTSVPPKRLTDLRIDWSQCPKRFKHALFLYVEDGVPPGHFMEAVLAGDLYGAVQRGNEDSLAELTPLVRFIYNQVPGLAWGCYNRIADWKVRQSS